MTASAHRNRRLAPASARETPHRSRAARAVSGDATDAFMLPLLSTKSLNFRGRSAETTSGSSKPQKAVCEGEALCAFAAKKCHGKRDVHVYGEIASKYLKSWRYWTPYPRLRRAV